MLGISKTKLYELIAQNEIEVIKLGSATLIVVASCLVPAFDGADLVSQVSVPSEDLTPPTYGMAHPFC